MTKKFLTFGIIIIILAGIFVPSVVLAITDGQCTADQIAAGGITRKLGDIVDSRITLTEYCQEAGEKGDQGVVGGAINDAGAAISAPAKIAANWMGAKLFEWIGKILMTLSSLILIISGYIFDKIVNFTIVNMSKNIGDPNGVGGSITGAWKTLRDIANMAFIFVLLFAAFKAMFNTDFSGFRNTVKNIIIVALLINFSLFFSKVVIDASNIASVGFYNSIVGANSNSIELVAGNKSTAPGGTSNFKGISGGYMRMLGLQTFYGADILTGQTDAIKIFILGFMSSIFMLITAVVLLIAGVMFATRFIILIFLMILSPLAFIAYIIPGMEGHFKKWKSALIDQSFFAPLFFALTWVVFKIGSSLVTVLNVSTQTGSGAQWTDMMTDPKSATALLLNYVLIIGFSIAALVLSKQMAIKTARFEAISGGIGTATIGGVARVGRNTVGRGSRALLNSDKLRNASSSEKWYSGAARAGLWTSKRGAESSFDLRASNKLGKVPGLGGELGILGKAGGKGGFSSAVDKKAKDKAAYSKAIYGQTDEEKEKANKEKRKYEGYMGDDGKWVKGAKEEYENTKKKEDERIKEERKAEKEKIAKTKEEATKNVKEKEEKLQQEKDARIAGVGSFINEEKANKELEESKTKLENITKAHELAIEREKAKIEDADYSEATIALKTEADLRKVGWDKIKNAGAERQRAYAKRLDKGKLGKVARGIGSGILSGSAGAVTGGAMGSLAGPIGTIVGSSVGGVLGFWGGVKTSHQGNKAAARAIIKQAEGKSKAEQLADAARDYQKEEDKKKEKNGATAEKATDTTKENKEKEEKNGATGFTPPPSSANS